MLGLLKCWLGTEHPLFYPNYGYFYLKSFYLKGENGFYLYLIKGKPKAHVLSTFKVFAYFQQVFIFLHLAMHHLVCHLRSHHVCNVQTQDPQNIEWQLNKHPHNPHSRHGIHFVCHLVRQVLRLRLINQIVNTVHYERVEQVFSDSK